MFRGYQTPFVVCEDWGWWVTIAGLHFSCGIGIYGIRIDDTDDLDFCVTVLTPPGKKWSWGRGTYGGEPGPHHYDR